ncbi:MAG: ABC transporter ATP-binding protein/permease [Alphaproteobacteria bacterium]|nr:ABC transporter ATP-binding protein/permease [Alphaproteobacteria bacterium]
MARPHRILFVALAVALVVLAVIQVVVTVRTNVWQGQFFDALEQRDVARALNLALAFVGLAAAATACYAAQIYVKMRAQTEWRRALTTLLLGRWLTPGRPYQLAATGDIDNPDHRATEDTRMACETSVDLLAGLVNAALLLVSFAGILWSLSVPLRLPIGVSVPGYLLWAALLYAGLGSLTTYLMGRALVGLANERNRSEGDFRFSLAGVRENAEPIALLRGEQTENERLVRRYGAIYSIARRLIRRTTMVSGITGAYATAAPFVPILVTAPQYLAGEISLGGMMQAAAAFMQVHIALSWFVDNFTRIADWRAALARIATFLDSIDDLGAGIGEPDDAIAITVGDGPSIRLVDLDVAAPSGEIVIRGATAEIASGERVLVIGESGTGKSSLARAVAGIWPWGRGRIELPEGVTLMVMPQRPYIPGETLREALAYPQPVDAFSVDVVRAALTRVGLDHLIDRIDGEENWVRTLSGGELQRLAFARVLLHKPAWVFMDEATAALDDEAQAEMLALFDNELAGTSIISIGHRPELEAFHTRTITLVRGEDGARLTRRKGRSRSSPGARGRAHPLRRLIAVIAPRRGKPRD